MSKNKGLPTGVTQEQVNSWKEKHGKVKMITVPRENGESVDYIIGRPDRTIVDMWAHHIDNDNRVKSREVLKKNCILFGDTSLFDKDVNLESTVYKKIQEMLELYRAEEKEL